MSAGSALASTGTLATSKTPNDKAIDFTGAAQTHSSGTGSKDEQALKEFIVEYVRAVASNEVSKQTAALQTRSTFTVKKPPHGQRFATWADRLRVLLQHDCSKL